MISSSSLTCKESDFFLFCCGKEGAVTRVNPKIPKFPRKLAPASPKPPIHSRRQQQNPDRKEQTNNYKMMLFTLLFVTKLIADVVGQTTYSFSTSRLGSYNHFVKSPQNGELIQTGGRLIERHLGYLLEAGFKSVLSISEFSTNDTIYNGVPGSYPSSGYEMSIVEGYGMKGKTVPSALTVDSAKEVSEVISEMEKPLYIHCHVSDKFFFSLFWFDFFSFLLVFRWDTPRIYFSNSIST